jgi:hypothetical protein
MVYWVDTLGGGARVLARLCLCASGAPGRLPRNVVMNSTQSPFSLPSLGVSSMRAALAVLLAVVLTGCGLEAVDTRIQYRSTVGDPHDHAIQIPEGKFVCANLIPLNNRPFNPEAMAAGEVEDTFGPYVPCNTLVDSGSGTCPTCQQKYHTEGAGEDSDASVEDSKTLSVKAQPAFVCPWEDCQKVISVGGHALEREDGKNATAGRNYCWHCKRRFSVVATDSVMTVGVHEELICPSCKQAVDPTLNVCTVSTCKLKGKVLNGNVLEAPCWRCGGVSICPNCHGSGTGTSGIFDYGSKKTPAKCWYCGETGRCPECDDDGFCKYEGSLPPEFKMFTGSKDTLKHIPAKNRKWRHKAETAPAAESGGEDAGGEDAGGEEEGG